MNNFDNIGLMIDCSRNAVLKKESVFRLIDLMAQMGYTCLQLYTEDTYAIDGEPYFGYLRGRYTKEELCALNAYANEKGIELIPCIQTLAHLNGICRWEPYESMFDCNDILLVGDERVYTLIEKMFASLRQCFTSNKINIGMDEAHIVGRGQYYDLHGARNRSEILAEHVRKVNAIAQKYAFKPMLWSDMFYGLGKVKGEDRVEITPEIADSVPRNVDLVCWEYYSTDKSYYHTAFTNHKKFHNDIWFAGGIWTWTGFAPNNRYSLQVADCAVSECVACGIRNIFFTLWGDNGGECSVFSMLPAMLYNAELCRGNNDKNLIKQKFRAICGEDWGAFMALDLPNRVGDYALTVHNPCRYMLYNDCFKGLFDHTVNEGDGACYADYEKQLRAYGKNSGFAYLFTYAADLCAVLSVKYEIGLKTRKAYAAGDIAALQILQSEYAALAEKTEIFLQSFKTAWYIEKKTAGFEVQECRIGGLIQRIRNCRNELLKKIQDPSYVIEDLEEQLLEPYLDKTTKKRGPVVFVPWNRIVTSNNLV